MESSEYPLSQDLVLVESGSPKRSTKITARTENLLAIHRKILLHLRNKKPLMKFELQKLLLILKRIDCSSPQDQKVAQSAQDILVRCIYSQTSKEEKTPQQHLSNTSRTNETETSQCTSDNTETKSQQSDVRSETSAQTESDQHFLNPSHTNDSELTGNATRLHQAESNQIPSSHSDSEAEQHLFDVGSETPDDLPYRYDKNAAITSHRTQSVKHSMVASASNIFSSQTTQGHDEMSYVEEMTVADDQDNSSQVTTIDLSHTFLRRHLSVSSNIDVDVMDNNGMFNDDDRSDINNRLDNDKWHENASNAPFTVPSLLEKRDCSSFSQGSNNILKLRLADVQFDSDTVSIPMELLTNRNFGSGEEQSQGLTGKYTQSLQGQTSRNKRFSLNSSEQNSQNRESNFTEQNVSTSSSDDNIPKSPFRSINENLSHNRYKCIQSYRDYSLKHTNNIESVTSKCNLINATSPADQNHGENISCATTSKSLSEIQDIGTNSDTPIANLETEATYSKNSNFNNSKGILYMTGEGKSNAENPKVHLEVPYVKHSRYVPRKNTLNNGNFDATKVSSNGTMAKGNRKNDNRALNNEVKNDHVKKFGYDWDMSNDVANNPVANNAWIMPLKKLPDTESFFLGSETPDFVSLGCLGAKENGMELCKSWNDEQEDLEITEAEERYLDMAANRAESEANSKTHEAYVRDADEGSFVFHLNTNYSEIIRRNPERFSKKNAVNYQEEEIPEDDRYIFCDKCQKDVVDYCDTCGMLVVVKDVNVPMGVPDRARKTAPPIFEIRESTVHGLGVFVKVKLPQGIRVGPYEGTISRISNTNGYSWKLRNGKLVDAGNETVSNWMRYVNCAEHVSGQNLVAFQYKGELFYRTARPIQEGEELLVYYGNSFARELGIEPKKYFDPKIESQLQPYYTCKHCRIGLTLPKFRDAHEKRCPFQRTIYHTGETFACIYCNMLYIMKADRDRHQPNCRKNPKSKCRENGPVEEEKKTYVCQHCNYKTNQKGSYNQHMLVHNKENAPKYRCSKCSYTTVYKRNLPQHLRTHDASGIVCQYCAKSFNEKKTLDNHLISKHPDKSELWINTITSKINKCPKCLYQTVFTSNFKRHLHTHSSGSDRDRYNCGICGYKAIQKCNFTIHLRLHVDQLPFVCIECKKRFNEKKNLDAHIVSRHSDSERLMNTVTNKIHNCHQCHYKTVKSTNLKLHIKSHVKNIN